MAQIGWSDVTSMPSAAAEFANVQSAGQTLVLNYVNSILDVDQFDGEDGATTKFARVALACHMLAVMKLGTGGPVTGESDGRFSRQYASPTARSEYLTTSYGRAFLLLIGPQAHGPRLL